MENKRRVMNDALGGLGGVNSISDVRLDLTIYEPLIVGGETKMKIGMRALLDISMNMCDLTSTSA